MLDLHTQALGLKPILWDALAPPAAGTAADPDPTLRARWYELMLDEIDYGVLLLVPRWPGAAHNHAARCELDAQHPLQLLGRQLRATDAGDAVQLQDALQAAVHRGLRRLLTLGQDAPPRRGVGGAAAQRRAGGCGRHPAVDGQAPDVRRAGRAVVRAQPRADAGRDARARSAVRRPAAHRDRRRATAWASPPCAHRSAASAPKTGADSIRELVRQVAVLPPMVGALRGMAEAGPQLQAA